MNLSDPEVINMIAKIVAVNVVATLVLAVLSYALGAFLLDRLTDLDRWLDPSRIRGNGHPQLKHAPSQPPEPTAPSGRGYS
jgi:hypothetical protein